MNAINHTEAQAIHAAASAAPAVLLEAADPSKNLILVPLSRLVSRPTVRNVRKTPRMSISELAASIQRVGLLQNLIVTATADGERYEVVAGGRRLAALKLLAKKHRISKEWEVPCLLVADGTARTASLTEENTTRRNFQQSLTDNLQTRSDNLRGVNLDEELSQLILYEQAFSAAARVIATIQEMFDALEQAV